MKDSITLHPKYGLNPTLATCFYCGKETGEIALLGNGYKDEAPRNLCVSLEPCAECKEKFKDYVLCIEAEGDESSSPLPSGRWLALRKHCFKSPPNDGICFMSHELFMTLYHQVQSAA